MGKKSTNTLVLRIIPYVSILTCLVVWQLIVVLNIVPNTLLASPLQVIKLFIYKLNHTQPDGGLILVHALVSLQEALIGYVLALVIGIPLGLAMGWFKPIDGLIRPLFEMLRPIPPVAWIPLTIFWFGIGMSGKVFIIFLAGLVPVVINSYTGVRMTNPVYIRMARTYGATKWRIFIDVCVPSALPMVFGGLQVALSVSWMTLVAAELIAADSGLGFFITMGQRLLMPDMIILGILMIGLTGVVIGIIVDKVEKRLVAGMWR